MNLYYYMGTFKYLYEPKLLFIAEVTIILLTIFAQGTKKNRIQNTITAIKFQNYKAMYVNIVYNFQ